MVFAIICTRRTGASTKRGSDGGKKENRAGQGRCVQEVGSGKCKNKGGSERGESNFDVSGSSLREQAKAGCNTPEL